MERRIIDLAKYRFSCCHETLEDAKIMYEAETQIERTEVFSKWIRDYLKTKGVL